MLKRALGKTGVEVSPLGLGTVKFGRSTGVAYPRAYELPTDAELADLLATAKALGVNLIDTAPAYGSSELRLGEALEGERGDWVLCTKAGEAFDGERSSYDFGEAAVLRSVEESLARLRTDNVDIVLLHSDGRPVEAIESAGAFRALARLRREGVVRATGFSAKSVLDAGAAMSRCDILMCTINARYRAEIEVAAQAYVRGVGVLVKKPLARGFEGDSSTLAEIACLRGVGSVVVGTTSPEHLRANAIAVGRSRRGGS